MLVSKAIKKLSPRVIDYHLFHLLRKLRDINDTLCNQLPLSIVSTLVTPKSGHRLPTNNRCLQATQLSYLHKFVLESTRWLTAQELTTVTGSVNDAASIQPKQWSNNQQIFSISIDGEDLFPSYALDINGKPLPIMMHILPVLSNIKGPLAIAIWFSSSNSWLNGKTPQDIVATQPMKVLYAAQAEASPIEHG